MKAAHLRSFRRKGQGGVTASSKREAFLLAKILSEKKLAGRYWEKGDQHKENFCGKTTLFERGKNSESGSTGD